MPSPMTTRIRCVKVDSFRSSMVRISPTSADLFAVRVNLQSLLNTERPMAGNLSALKNNSKRRNSGGVSTHLRARPRRCLYVLSRACTTSTFISTSTWISGYPIHSKFCSALNAGKNILNTSMGASCREQIQNPKSHTNHNAIQICSRIHNATVMT